MTALDYGRVRCPRCHVWYGLDETHVCASSSIQLATAAADPATIPDPDRAHPIGLTWVSPLTPRPIILGPSANHPDLRPALDLAADRFWTAAKHGTRIARRRQAMDDAALDFALSADPSRSPHLALAMAEAAGAWTDATDAYASDLFGATA
jgi:hypothetical protein